MRVRQIGWAAAAVLMLVLAGCGGPPQPGQELAVSDRAPDFTLPSADGTPVSLAGFRGTQSVLLYFSMGPG